MPFEASQAIFRSLFSQKESKLSSTGLAFVPEAKLQLSTFRYAQKAKFRDFFEKVSLPFRLLPFASYPPRFFCFSFPSFFSFVGHLLGFLLVGKDFAKRSRIVKFF